MKVIKLIQILNGMSNFDANTNQNHPMEVFLYKPRHEKSI